MQRLKFLLLKRRENDVWETLVKPGKKCKPGTIISFGDGLLMGEVIDVVEEGNRLIQFKYEGIFEEVLDQLGEMPLPPYITHKLEDKTDIRQFMQSMKVLQLHQQQVFILQRSCWSRLRKKV